MELTVLHRQEFPLQELPGEELLADVAESVSPIFQDKGIEFHLRTEQAYVMADFDLLKTLLINLVDNSIKAGAGRIELGGRKEEKRQVPSGRWYPHNLLCGLRTTDAAWRRKRFPVSRRLSTWWTRPVPESSMGRAWGLPKNAQEIKEHPSCYPVRFSAASVWNFSLTHFSLPPVPLPQPPCSFAAAPSSPWSRP